MGKRRKRNRGTDEPTQSDFARIFAEVGLNPELYEFAYSFTKGALTGDRGIVVDVMEKQTGRKVRKSAVSRTKREARNAVTGVLAQCLYELK